MELLKQPKEYGYFTSRYFDSEYFDVLYYDNNYVEKQETEEEIIYSLKNNLKKISCNLKIILITPVFMFVLEQSVVKVCYFNTAEKFLDKITEVCEIVCDTYIRNKELDVELEKIKLEKMKLDKK